MHCQVILYKIRVRMKIIFYTIVKKLTKQKMIIDVTGTVLTPGNGGRGCLGNGEHFNLRGKMIECCCNECDYMMCCVDEHDEYECIKCTIAECPRSAFEKIPPVI